MEGGCSMGKFSLFVIDSWFIIFIEFSFQKVSIHRNEQNGQEYIRVTKTNCVSREACMAFLLWESFASIWKFSRWTTKLVVARRLR